MHLVDGIDLSLASRAFSTAVRPKLLSILGNIETTSQETNKVPSGKGPLVLSSLIIYEKYGDAMPRIILNNL